MKKAKQQIDEAIIQHWRDHTVQMIADKLGEPYNTVWDHCLRLGIWPISAKDLKVATILQHADKKPKEIAKLLNCTANSVRQLVREFDIKLAPQH